MLKSICMLAQKYSEPEGRPEDWFYSPKFDGQRALWTGQELVSRYGNKIHAPDWFLNKLPSHGLDGELWSGYDGKLEEIRSIVSRHVPDERWAKILYIPFDVVEWNGNQFRSCGSIQSHVNSGKIQIHQVLESWDDIGQHMDDELDKGGEGIMLRRRYSYWENKRSRNLLKVKPDLYGIGYISEINPGIGRLEGLMGSLTVMWSNPELRRDVPVNVSGFTDVERLKTWRIGDLISFKYVSLTKAGVPREARYAR